MDVENIVYINCVSIENKAYLEELLANSELYLFLSFGLFLDNDIYIDLVEFDMDIDPYVIGIKFENNNPGDTIKFCNEISNKFQVNIRYSYLNKELNYAGKYIIHNCNVVCNLGYSYWYGLYLFNYDKFWQTISEVFEYFIDFDSMIKAYHFEDIPQKDLEELHARLTDYLNMKYLNLAFKNL